MPNDKETIENLYNLLRAVVFKFGRDVTVTKEEFIQSLGGSFTIQPQDDETFLRIWSVHERPNVRVATAGRKGSR